ncbi:hypothetical protein JCGZ_06042 [Jatropha curcas]|uniref:Uncharacterized protein n=1 Tax=Jatropha curcas TaxID=180498 RepID=A0A067J9I2_JATCU|nr:hypothetical protein JCGZ_06042 [Jatropha curcas]
MSGGRCRPCPRRSRRQVPPVPVASATVAGATVLGRSYLGFFTPEEFSGVPGVSTLNPQTAALLTQAYNNFAHYLRKAKPVNLVSEIPSGGEHRVNITIEEGDAANKTRLKTVI